MTKTASNTVGIPTNPYEIKNLVNKFFQNSGVEIGVLTSQQGYQLANFMVGYDRYPIPRASLIEGNQMSETHFDLLSQLVIIEDSLQEGLERFLKLITVPSVIKVFWKNGESEVLPGETFSEAMTQAGYSQGAVQAVDYYEYYNFPTKGWTMDYTSVMCIADKVRVDCIHPDVPGWVRRYLLPAANPEKWELMENNFTLMQW